MEDDLSTLNPNSYFHLLSFRESKKISMDLEDDFFIEEVENDFFIEEVEDDAFTEEIEDYVSIEKVEE